MMQRVVATVHAAEPNPNVATVIAAVAVVTAVAEASIAAVPMVTVVADASTIDDIPEVILVSADLMSPAAADGTGEKRGRKRGTTVPRWTPEEEARLRALVEELGEKDWISVVGRLETERSPAGVEQHWQIMSGKRKRNGEKATKEDGTGEAYAEGESTPGSTAEKKAAKAVLRAEKEASNATKSAAKEERAAEKAAEKESKETGLAAKRAAKEGEKQAKAEAAERRKAEREAREALPKKALSAYLHFCNAMRAQLKVNDPTLALALALATPTLTLTLTLPLPLPLTPTSTLPLTHGEARTWCRACRPSRSC